MQYRDGYRIIPISIHAPLAGCDKVSRAYWMQAQVISIHAPLAGCDPRAEVEKLVQSGFQSTHPLRGATLQQQENQRLRDISIHAPLAGCDDTHLAEIDKKLGFQSTHPLRGATRDYTLETYQTVISIHAPLAGCDGQSASLAWRHIGFQSTHPLRGATCIWTSAWRTSTFQSTHPLRGATPCKRVPFLVKPFQSTHPLRGATHGWSAHMPKFGFQSTHPLRGATVFGWLVVRDENDFNPRTPCGVRLYPARGCAICVTISIHAPLAGCDDSRPTSERIIKTNFNPRTPCGVRLAAKLRRVFWDLFQSTHPLRGATAQNSDKHCRLRISIHAPLAGCDAGLLGYFFHATNFNPRTPCGVRPE